MAWLSKLHLYIVKLGFFHSYKNFYPNVVFNLRTDNIRFINSMLLLIIYMHTLDLFEWLFFQFKCCRGSTFSFQFTHWQNTLKNHPMSRRKPLTNCLHLVTFILSVSSDNLQIPLPPCDTGANKQPHVSPLTMIWFCVA